MAAAEVSGAATRTWVLKTNENGFCELYSRFLVSGDDFYYTSSGVPTLPIGTVLIQETKAPEGYFINDTVYLVKISESGTDEAIINTYNAPIIPEQVYTGSVSISKTTVTGLDKHTVPEDGAVFEVYLKSAGSYAAAAETDRALLTTDAEGNASAGDLPYGTYTVHQVSGWEGNTLYPDFDVTISADGQSYHFTLNNERFYAFVLVKKVDATTGAEIPTAGVGFQVKDPTGRYVSDLAGANKWYTDENGFLRLPMELEYGKRYSLLELNAPSGYVLGSEPLYFDVTAENATDSEGQKVVEVTMENTPQMGTITVKKTGEYFASVTEREGVYQPVFKVGGLSGAEYSITAAEDIYTPDGTLRYRKNTVVDTLVTGEDGTATTKALYLGKFTVTETKAPHGTLLQAMETAGRNVADIELKEAMSGSGLGTPATRAGIIENIIKTGYAVRDGKKLLPTEVAFIFTDFVAEQLKKPELTAEWEKSLAEIHKGSVSPETFMQRISLFVTALVEEAGKACTSQVDNAVFRQERKSIGICPRCAQRVVEYPRSFSCESGKEGCGFTIWKTIAGRTISPTQAEKLLNSRKTDLIKGFVGRSGKKFDAFLILRDDNSVGFNFQKG